MINKYETKTNNLSKVKSDKCFIEQLLIFRMGKLLQAAIKNITLKEKNRKTTKAELGRLHQLLTHIMKTVILRTHKRTKSNSFPEALFWTFTVAPSVCLFNKLAKKSTTPIIVLPP
jgi:hypothetical protein